MNLSLCIAQGFYVGKLRPAPGTWGSFAAWWAFNLLGLGALGPLTLLICIGAFALGVWACTGAARALGVADHGSVVWDEVVAVWLVLAFVPGAFWSQLWAVLLFRLFDIWKPQPIRYFDTKWKNGFGVMWDDIVAAGYTLLVLALVQRVL